MSGAVLRAIIVVVLGTALVGCGPTPSPPRAAEGAGPPPAVSAPAPSPPPPAAEPEVVRVGTVRSINAAPFIVAMGRGYYQEEGILLEPAEFRSAADIVSALGTGQLDVSIGTISAGTFNAWQRGVKLIVAAPTSLYPAEGLMPQNVVVRKELVDSGAVRSAADFRGRKVALNVRGGINELVVMRVLARRGLTLDDVDVQTMPFPDMIPALANGSIDVLTASDPYGTMAILQGVGVRLEEDQRSVGQLQPTHFLFSERFTTARAEAAVRFLIATMRGARELQGNWLADPTLAQIMEDELGFKREVLAQAILPTYPPDLITRPEDVELFQDAFMRLGHLSYTTPLDVTPFVNNTLAQRAKERLDARRR
ncbi:MAG TPA: ABC transporter substrate-binding protein [Chloroflexota bacterium]|nr:ABC transporter substrate-binding protein [Chloroflexota bacterium]